MDLHVTLHGDGPPLGTQIYRRLADAIVDGRLLPGARLPATRSLASELDVARATVVQAYERLVAEGLAVSRVGAGTFVGDAHPRAPSRRARDPAGPSPLRPTPRWRELGRATAIHDTTSPRYDFSVGVPDPALFPMDVWRRLLNQAARSTATAAGQYGDPAGTASLRSAIARHAALARDVRATADQVLVTRGAQQAFDLLARVLVEPGTCVAVEEPGYPPLRHLLASLGANVVPVPVTDDGLDVGALPDQARLVFVTPSHQFPLGTTMPLETRTALLAWAEAHDAVVVEDDYDSEFRYTDRPLAPLQRLDRSQRVLYVGSFSKTTLPSLRLGYLIAPASLQPALRAAKTLADGFTDPVVQHAMARFLDEGEFSHHVRRARRAYARRRETLLEAIDAELTRWLTPIPAIAGLHVTARLAHIGRRSPDTIAGEAGRTGIRVETLTAYSSRVPPEPALVLGYGAIRPPQIREGLHLLRGVLEARSAG